MSRPRLFNLAGQIAIEMLGPPDGRISDEPILAVDATRHLIASVAQESSTMAVLLPGPSRGFAADWVGATSHGGLRLTIGVDVVNLREYMGGDGTGFLGIVSAVDFSRVDIGQDDLEFFNEAFGADNFRFTPEPGPGLLASVSLLTLSAMARVKRARRSEKARRSRLERETRDPRLGRCGSTHRATRA